MFSRNPSGTTELSFLSFHEPWSQSTKTARWNKASSPVFRKMLTTIPSLLSKIEILMKDLWSNC